MRFMIHASFAFTLVAFTTGMIQPLHNPRLTEMKAEFAAAYSIKPFLPHAWR
jgi:hypothetical protein